MVESASLQELSGKIRGGEIRSEEVIAWAYDRIEAHDSDLNVFRSRLDRETALKKAREIDQRAASGEKLGPLAGIPVSIKDNICFQDPELNGSCASAILEDYASPYDAHVVERLKAADAIIIGKTNMDEFAMGSSTENSAYGPTLNPWDRDRVPGGSSGGAAVSVASGMVLLALGSDTGGSVRQPASLCGVTGVKPSYGSVSRYGLVAYGSSLDQIGCLAKSSEDCSYALEVIQGHDPRDSTSSDQTLVGDGEDLELKGKRFCLPETYLDPEVVDAEVIEAISEAESMLLKEGAVIEKRPLEFLRFVIPTYYILAFAEASSNLGRFDGIRYGVRSQKEANLKSLYSDSRSKGFGREVQRRIMLGTFVLSSGYYDQFYGRATRVRAGMEQQIGKLFEEFDFILGPVSPFPAFPLGEKSEDPLAMYLADLCSVLPNLTRCPAISIPGKPTKAGLPVGIQLMGRRFEDPRLLAAARGMQQHLQYYQLAPNL